MTYTTAAPRAITPKQQAFIGTLLTERNVPDTIANRINVNTLTSYEASRTIEQLLAYPRKVTFAPTPTLDNSVREYFDALASVPLSRYALPMEDLEPLTTLQVPTNDTLFLEVKERQGKRYLNRLHAGGFSGGFIRSRVNASNADKIILLKIIGKDPYAAAKRFGEAYECCGCCGRELTDTKSRALQIGPECRKRFNL